jgi:hypothetical protein
LTVLSENQPFFNAITDPDWLHNVPDVYENDGLFSVIINLLFDYLQIPNENLVAAGPLSALQRNLANRLVALRLMGFAAIERDREAMRRLATVRFVSEIEGYYNPNQHRITPKAVSPDMSPGPDRPGPVGQNRDGDDRAGSDAV